MGQLEKQELEFMHDFEKNNLQNTVGFMQEQNSGIQALANHLPGGVLNYLFDDKLTLLQFSDGFLSMFGYSRKEINQLFQDSLLEMICPADRKTALENTRQQQLQKDMKDSEYRIKCKDGSLIWVLEKGQFVINQDGEKSFYCILIDITQQKNSQDELRLSLERHKIIMDQTTDIIFEWDMVQGSLIFSTNWEKKFGYHPIDNSIFSEALLDSHLCPDDIPAFKLLMEKIRSGVSYDEAEFRIANKNKRFIWCRVRATTQFDTTGRPVKCVGVILDIDNDKRLELKLLEKAERDALTGLYNKITCQELIESCLEASSPDTQSALLIIDIDDFKRVNDSLGHLFGDAVLADIANGIKKLFRCDDIIGRIGGDEFVIFLKNIYSEKDALSNAERILEMFRGLFEHSNKAYQVFCSVGIALYPKDGRYFQKLYKNADHALYHAKSKGKNCSALYLRQSLSASMERSALNAPIDSNQNGNNLGNRLVEYVFHALYQSDNIEAAVSVILEIIGKQFNVSRAYIFEDSEDSSFTDNTFEWCNEGIPPEKHMLQHVLHNELGDYYTNFDENDIFYCRDIHELSPGQRSVLEIQKIKSMLQCAIRDNGKIKGFVGFDDCSNHRLWTQEQIDALTMISEILSIFLLKQRAQVRVMQKASQMRMMLDNQTSWIYAVEYDSFRLLYINKKTIELVPNSAPGMFCYKAFFNRETPCEVCPVRSMHGDETCSMEIYNPVLKVWTLTDSSIIRWDDREARLLTCHNITNYKKTTNEPS